MTDVLYVENLAAAEELVRRGQFNAAKVLRALAHAQRAEAMARARNSDVDLPDLLRRNHVTLTDAPARDIAGRALASLADHVDVAESDVDQHIWGCYGCGRLVEGERPDSCPACGALAVEFEWFGPFYAANPEHLGQQSPADVLALLRRTPDEVARVLHGRTDLGVRPAPDEWSIAEIVGHLIETDGVFRSRVTTVLADDGVPALDSRRPWTLHEGKGYEQMSADALLAAFRDTRAETVALVEGLTDADWMRKGTVRGTANSVLDLGSWLANHDVGHLAQAHR
jgi:DinB family protein